jgi:hypothetical protein
MSGPPCTRHNGRVPASPGFPPLKSPKIGVWGLRQQLFGGNQAPNYGRNHVNRGPPPSHTLGSITRAGTCALTNEKTGSLLEG